MLSEGIVLNGTVSGGMVGGSVVTTGTFDGVHRGHRRVLELVSEISQAEGLEPLVVTFDRHPLETVAPERAPRLLMDPERRDSLLRESGMNVLRMEFGDELRRKTAAEWMRELRDAYDMRVLVLGYDNTFGSDGREMSFEDYRSLGTMLGIRVEVAPAVDGCSSSAARRAVASGDMEKAREILGRPFELTGIVGHGRELGRTIGVPTANLETGQRQLLPLTGVYGAEAVLPDGTLRPAVVNVGDNPTVSGDGATRVEAHLIGYDGNLYGRGLTLRLTRRLRDERRFGSLADLRDQIARDIAALG